METTRQMTITLRLPGDLQKRIEQRAADNGQDVADYVQKLIERDLVGEYTPIHLDLTFDEILAPVRRDFLQAGVTEEEFDALAEKVREGGWQQKPAQRSPASDEGKARDGDG